MARFAETSGRQRIWRDRLIDYLRAERDRGRLLADTDVEATAALLVGICHDTALLSAAPRSSRPRVEAIVATVMSGIAPAGSSPPR